MLNWLNRMGEPLYGHETPDGYPLTEAAWSGPGEMETRFEIARQIGAGASQAVQAADDTRAAEPAPPPLLQQTAYYQAAGAGPVAGHHGRHHPGPDPGRPQHAVPVLARIHASVGVCHATAATF